MFTTSHLTVATSCPVGVLGCESGREKIDTGNSLADLPNFCAFVVVRSGGDSSVTDAQPNFRAVSDTPQDALYGALEPTDLEWTCAGGFATETQVWYSVLEDGSLVSSQIIHSAVG